MAQEIEKLIPGGAPSVSHKPAKNTAEWKEQLVSVASGTEYTITKTLVFKPSKSHFRSFIKFISCLQLNTEGAKPESGKLVLLIADAETQTPGNVIAKSVNAKDARIADAATIKDALDETPENGKCTYIRYKEIVYGLTPHSLAIQRKLNHCPKG